MSRTRSRTWITAAILLGIVALAAFYRLYRIDALPPGDGYDPAWYGVDALAILDGYRPIFLPTNFGREVMFSYLAAINVALFGIGPPAIHITSAVIGIATIVAIFLAANELFAEETGVLREYGGLLAAFVLAVSYWHLVWSRYGVRAILTPLFAALIFYLLWRAFRTEKRWLFAAAGAVLGLSAYTYQASRFLPLVVVLGFVIMALHRRRITRDDLINFAILVAAALIVFAPLGYYFLTHPGSFFERVNQTWAVDASTEVSSGLLVFWERFRDLFLILSLRGEDKILFNLPGRPVLGVFFSLFFYLGLIVGLIRIRKPNYQFMFAWLLVMSLPAVLAAGRATKRAIGALPVVVLFVVVGFMLIWAELNAWDQRRRSGWSRAVRVGGQTLLMIALAFSAVATFRDYFIRWGNNPDLFTHFEMGEVTVGQYAGSLPADELVYVSPLDVTHPGIVYNSGGRTDLHGYDGRLCLPIPPPSKGATYIVVPDELHDPASLPQLEALFPEGEIVGEGPLHYGQPYFLAFGVPPGADAGIKPKTDAGVSFDGWARLLGFDLEQRAYRPGETIPVTLYFSAETDMDANYTVFVQLLGQTNPATQGPFWAGDDSEPCRQTYPTSRWVPGEIVRDVHMITIPDGTPAGEYELRMGLYEWPSLTRLPVFDVTGSETGDSYRLAPIEIVPEQ
ncbi:MAG: glycosyltransferase family 39 protein [Caldilineales bacterium]|nr:glycosyltransferase family 39 protein [Caldilineales bacterium]